MTQLDNPELYTIGWISALSIERAAAIALLDDRHDAPETFAQHPSDNNSYEWGRIGKHNIVIASLPDGVYGTTSAATTASNLISSLPHIRIGLLVGIGGGIAQPGQDQDIRLGDVVVSQSDGPTGGVVQYDLGKAKLDHWERKGSLHKPPQVLLHALGGLRAKHERQPSEIPNLLQRIYTANPLMTRPKTNYTHQGFGNDHLFPSDYNHVEGNTCDKCDQSREVKRDPRDSTDPEIHYGVIASGNTLVKNASTRDSIFKIAGEQCMCVEMEAAGLMDHFPCLVIRGVCDYADSHKNDRWQRYAAVTAAAYAKELLGFVPTKDLKATPRAIDIPRLIHHKHTQQHDIKEVKARTIRIEESLSNVEKRDVHDRLELTNPSPLHNTASGLYEEGTGDWVFRTPEWNSWLSKSSKRCLWIHGIPGSGKTVLISHIINHIENSYTQTTSNENVCSVYYYCYFGRNQNEAAPMLRWVISQLCRKSDVVATSVYALVNRGIEPKLSDLLDALEDALDPFAMVYLAVDALDETIQKTDLLTILFALATEGRFRKLQLLITSREYHHIEEVVKPVSISISMSNEFVTEDIRVYLEIVMRNDRRFSHSRWTSDLLQLILDLVPRKANGM
ncbi:nucleoside phosphorylase domain-containing protein [Mariannaea sp. PMI_226]|nr:nucleoside phosphorylase domain-containing protein [Mariannaea sp. PMI_226]